MFFFLSRLIYNAVTEFIGRASEFKDVWEASLEKFKTYWKGLTVGQYLDIDAAAAGLTSAVVRDIYIHMSVYISMYVCMHVYLSIYLSIYLSVSIYLSIYLSI